MKNEKLLKTTNIAKYIIYTYYNDFFSTIVDII